MINFLLSKHVFLLRKLVSKVACLLWTSASSWSIKMPKKNSANLTWRLVNNPYYNINTNFFILTYNMNLQISTKNRCRCNNPFSSSTYKYLSCLSPSNAILVKFNGKRLRVIDL